MHGHTYYYMTSRICVLCFEAAAAFYQTRLNRSDYISRQLPFTAIIFLSFPPLRCCFLSLSLLSPLLSPSLSLSLSPLDHFKFGRSVKKIRGCHAWGHPNDRVVALQRECKSTFPLELSRRSISLRRRTTKRVSDLARYFVAPKVLSSR